MKPWLAFDIGCIECGEESKPVGLFDTEEEALAAAKTAEEIQSADWHGQHYFDVFDLSEFIPISVPAVSV